MLAEQIIRMIGIKAKRQLKCETAPDKVRFLFTYAKDELKISADFKTKDGKEKTAIGESQKISDNAELNALFTSRINKIIKPDSVVMIASDWIYTTKEINTIVLFLKDGKKLKHEEKIKFNEA